MSVITQRVSSVPFTDATLPVVFDDPRIVPGTLAMIDLTNTEGRDVLAKAAVPGDQAAIPDVAWRHAANVMGIADPVRTAFNHRFATNAATKPTQMKLERTGKGGLHGLVSQTVDDGSTYSAVLANNHVRDYIAAHLDHTYLGLMWTRTTRSATALGNYFEQEIDNNFGAAGSFLLRYNNGFGTVGQPARGYGVATGWTGNFQLDGFGGYIAGWGNFGGYGGLSGVNNKRSYVLDLAMLIDVTYAQSIDPTLTITSILASNEALRQAAYAPGGKYAGDVIPTAPAGFA